mgnify:CR=1 FL=1
MVNNSWSLTFPVIFSPKSQAHGDQSTTTKSPYSLCTSCFCLVAFFTSRVGSVSHTSSVFERRKCKLVPLEVVRLLNGGLLHRIVTYESFCVDCAFHVVCQVELGWLGLG